MHTRTRMHTRTHAHAPTPTQPQGQRLAEWLLMRILVVFAAVSFVVGYAKKDFMLMAQINGAGVVLAALLVLPSWPPFNRHHLRWLPPLEPPEQPK